MFVGYMGNIIFVSSESWFLSPKDISRSGSPRWETHNLMMKKPVSEFGGAGLEQISFKLDLVNYLGVNVRDQLEELRLMRDSGIVFPLVLGGRPLIDNYWYISEMSEDGIFTDGTGKLTRATVSISLVEYDDSNYTEERTLIDDVEDTANAISTVIGGNLF